MRRTSPLLPAALVALLLVGACGPSGDGDDTAAAPSDTAPLVDGPTVTSPADPTPSSPDSLVPLDDIGLDLDLVATVVTPMAMTTVPGEDDLVWVARRDGRLQEIDLDEGGEGVEILDFSDDVSTTGEQGFLGVAVAPDGEHLYTSYTDADGASRIDEYGLGGGEIDEASRRKVFGLPQPFSNHNGGNITFGPDGYLYLGLGDGGDGGDPDENGQNTSTLLGSIIRIDPVAQGERTYGVPSDNPFTEDGGRSEIWLYGVRNPWRFSFDRTTGDLWVGDVGQSEIEEVDLLPATDGVDAGKGANLGWNLVEGTQEFAGAAPPDHEPPIYDYEHSDGYCSITGGFVYRGEDIPDLVGTYLFADYCVSEIRGVRPSPTDGVEEAGFGIGGDPNTLVSFGQDAAGELYVLSSSGEISRIVAG